MVLIFYEKLQSFILRQHKKYELERYIRLDKLNYRTKDVYARMATCVEAAVKQRRGTMIVITDEAEN